MSAKAIEILESGPLALIQDSGRHGHMAVGVGRAGAADHGSYALGGRLLGNPEGLAAIEVVLGGLRLRARGDLTLCLTGAEAPATADGRAVAYGAPFPLRDGAELRLGVPPAGLRTYVSVRGGLAYDPVLGSTSSDTMSGLGPPALTAGDVVPIGPAPRELPHVDHAPTRPFMAGEITIGVGAGPRRDWFADPTDLERVTWSVSDRSDRKGVRLTGGSLQRTREQLDAELPSEGMVRGAIQVPPNGEPVIFLNDYPVTGGYPVIGVVRSADIDRVAQLRPGDQLRLRWDESPPR